MDNDIETPLGQSRASKSPRHMRGVRRFPYGLALAGAAIFGTSAYVASLDDNFRFPDREIASGPAPVATVAAAPAGEDATVDARAPSPKAAAPAILRVGEAQAPADNVIVVRNPSSMAANARLAHLPDRALIEQSEMGPLPVRAEDGRRPFDVYAGSWSGARGARVAIVIGGLGVSQTGTEAAIDKLPAEITLAFAPQGNSLSRWMQVARREGHEIILQVPLEPFDYPTVNPGRNTLTVEATPEQNIAELRWALARVTNYTGVMNYMGGRFVAEREAMAPLMQELGERGLLYLDDGSTARSVAAELAPPSGVPFVAGDAVIDSQRERGAILKKLDQLEATARARGYAVGTGYAFDATVDTVAAWANDVRKRGIELVPVSAVASDPERGQ